jgi:hypothetical protein
MQDYINKHPQRIDKLKLTLWNLVQWDSAGLQVQFYIPDNGTVEAYDNEDPDEVGSLGWIHDWCVRPTSVKAFYKFNLERRKEKSLAKLYKIEDAEDYPYCPKYYRESTYRPWSQYVKVFIEKRRLEREFWFSLGLDPGPTEYPSNQEVINAYPGTVLL